MQLSLCFLRLCSRFLVPRGFCTRSPRALPCSWPRQPSTRAGGTRRDEGRSARRGLGALRHLVRPCLCFLFHLPSALLVYSPPPSGFVCASPHPSVRPPFRPCVPPSVCAFTPDCLHRLYCCITSVTVITYHYYRKLRLVWYPVSVSIFTSLTSMLYFAHVRTRFASAVGVQYKVER